MSTPSQRVMSSSTSASSSPSASLHLKYSSFTSWILPHFNSELQNLHNLPSPTTQPTHPRAMYAQTTSAFPGADVTQPLALPFTPSLSAIPDHFIAAEFDSAAGEAFKPVDSDVCHSSSSGCSSYGSPTSYGTQGPGFFQRSMSSLSIQMNQGPHGHFTSGHEPVDSGDSPLRRNVSASDLQRVNMVKYNHEKYKTRSSLASESCSIIEGMSKACRYNPEEKKERIERYRNKRTQRNFNKKIKYECRKTLADSRPRINGRFARNDEAGKIPQVDWNQNIDREEVKDYDDNWFNFINDFAANILQ